jgi:predicted RNA-binding protein YlxR (DUF448 family)
VGEDRETGCVGAAEVGEERVVAVAAREVVSAAAAGEGRGVWVCGRG